MLTLNESTFPHVVTLSIRRKWRRHLWTASKKISLSFSSQSPLTFGEQCSVYILSFFAYYYFIPRGSFILGVLQNGGAGTPFQLFPWLMTEFIVIVCQVTKSSEGTIRVTTSNLMPSTCTIKLPWCIYFFFSFLSQCASTIERQLDSKINSITGMSYLSTVLIINKKKL